MVKCNASCRFQNNGECILHPDKLKFKVSTNTEDFSKQILECCSQVIEDRDSGMR